MQPGGQTMTTNTITPEYFTKMTSRHRGDCMGSDLEAASYGLEHLLCQENVSLRTLWNLCNWRKQFFAEALLARAYYDQVGTLVNDLQDAGWARQETVDMIREIVSHWNDCDSKTATLGELGEIEQEAP
jgi:hypothetical protein